MHGALLLKFPMTGKSEGFQARNCFITHIRQQSGQFIWGRLRGSGNGGRQQRYSWVAIYVMAAILVGS